MPDRFYNIDKPPVIVGRCSVCHDEIQKGDEKQCELCLNTTCEDCLRECWVCKKKGCKWCINKTDHNKEFVCLECILKRRQLTDRARSTVYIPDYNCSGVRETDEETILEYSSADQPGIEVRIKKVRN